MSYGILNTGNSVKQQALGGLRQNAQEETNRNIANKNLDQAEKMATKSNMGAGAGVGASIGLSAAASGAATAASTGVAATGIAGMGALGAGLAGGGIGLAAGFLLSELF